MKGATVMGGAAAAAAASGAAASGPGMYEESQYKNLAMSDTFGVTTAASAARKVSMALLSNTRTSVWL
eukprot:5337882-Pyramimonas_sp.AAC.1